MLKKNNERSVNHNKILFIKVHSSLHRQPLAIQKTDYIWNYRYTDILQIIIF